MLLALVLILHYAEATAICSYLDQSKCWVCPTDDLIQNPFCFSSCPSGYFLKNNSCVLTNKLILNSVFEPESKQTLSELFQFDPEKTWIGAKRGVFLDQNSKITIKDKVLMPSTTCFGFWAFLDSPGLVLNSNENVRLWVEEGFLNVKIYNGLVVSGFGENEWQKVTICVSAQDCGVLVETLVNGVKGRDCVQISDGFRIEPETWSIGGPLGFEGFVYSFFISGERDYGPDYFGLVNCGIREYQFESTCYACLNQLYPCNPNQISSHHRDRHLSFCTNCLDCTVAGVGPCVQCDSTFKLVQSYCVSQNPTLISADEFSMIQSSTEIFSLDFREKIKNTLTDSISSISVMSGSSSSYYPSYESSDAYASKERGYYFSGSSYMRLQSTLIIAPEFTISVWLSGTLSTGSFCMFSKDYILKYGINTGTQFLTFTSNSFTSNTVLSDDTWTNLIATGYGSGGVFNMIFYIDKVQEISSSTYQYYLDDTSSFYPFIGSCYDSAMFFNGFILAVKIWNTYFDQSSDIDTIYSSFTFPSYCGILTFYDGSTCSSCDASCTEGCVNGVDCVLCYSERCVECTGYLAGDCTSCISHASGASCDCSTTYFWDSTNHVCSLCQANCDACTSSNKGDCSACSSSYYLIQSVCNKACPTGYTGSCTYDHDNIFFLDLNNKILDSLTDSQSSLSVSTGSSTSFYPNYLSSDPYATKDRGYYFTGTSYLQVASNSIKFAPEHSIFAWLNPETVSAVVFSKQSTTESIIYSFELYNSYISITFPGQSFASMNYFITTSTWNFIGIKLSINSNFNYEITFQINSNSELQTSSSVEHFDDDTSSFTLLIGGSYPLLTGGFTGFIWKFGIYNSKNADFSTLSSETMPNNCPLTEFDLSGTCTACDASCTNGCARVDTKCNLCSDQQCATCEDFTSSCLSCITNASGSPCDCSTKYFWDSVNEVCSSCTSNCDTCVDGDFDSCSFCAIGYYLAESICTTSCPTGYTSDSTLRTCTKASTPVLDLTLTSITDQISVSSLVFTTGEDTSFYPSYKTTDPYAAKYRGYYFTGTSYMQGPPNSASSAYFDLPGKFTIVVWVKPITAGVIFSFQDAGDTECLTLEIVSGAFKSTIFLNSGYTLTGNNADLKGWNFVGLTGSVSATPAYQVKLTVNSSESASGDLDTVGFDKKNRFFTIGCKRSAAGFTSYFQGFLYQIQVFGGVVDLTTVVSSSCSGCTVCPLSGGCLPNCNIGFYYDGSKCVVCKASCSAKGCVRFDTSCNLCSDTLCDICFGYDSVCDTCKSGSTLISNVCTCSTGYAFDSVTEVCKQCPSPCSECSKSNPVRCTACDSGYYLALGTCMGTCPWGYTISGSTCVLDSKSGYVFNLQLQDIQDIITDSQSSIQVTTGSSSSSYPTYDSTDPLANKRGYYFTGTSYMSLPPNYVDTSTVLLFSPVFTISCWIRYTTAGVIFIKQSSSSPYTASIKIYLSGDYPTISLYLDNYGTISNSELSCSNQLTKMSWQQVAFKIGLNDATEVTCVINQVSETTQQLGFYLLNDFSSSFTITIGAEKTSSFSNFLTGFIYSVKIWTILEDPSSLDVGTCSGCSICPPDGCLPDCGVDQFWDGSTCQYCSSSCDSVGCVRLDTKCNMCFSQLCKSCTDFTSSCSACIDNASGASNCQCSSGYYFDSNLEECTECPSTCSSCTSSSLVGCTGCTGTTYALFDLCRNFCPSGYVISSNDCIESDTIILSLTFNSISGVVTDQSPLALKATTGSSSKFYPTYDSNDPKPSRYRGYHFDGTSSVVNLPPFGSYSTPIIYFSPAVSFESWIYPTQSSGTILSKQDVTNYAKILSINLSSDSLTITGYFDSLGITTYTCTLTVTLNAWNYIGFKITYSATESSASCSVDATSSSSTSLGVGFLDDTIASYKYTIGAGSSSTGNNNYFKGFIYQIKIYNKDQSLTEYSNSCTGGCSICPLDGNCLASCSFSQYWVGSNHDSCASCDAGCTNGCLSNSVKCNLCSDIRCKVCTDYSSGTCTECITNAETISNCVCKSGFFWNTATETCDSCHSSCGTCTASDFMSCQTCASGFYFLNNACHAFCPTGFSISGTSCSQSLSPAFKLVLEKISGVIYDSVSNIPVVTGSTSTFYPSMETNDPYPLKDRGYYFTGASVMKLPPSAQYLTPLFKLGNSFTISLWTTWVSDGTLISVQSSNYASSLTITLTSQPVMSVRLMDSDTLLSYTCQNTISSYWNYLAFYVKLGSNGDTSASCTVNTATDSLSVLQNGYHNTYTSFFTLGAKVLSSSTFGSYLQGYIYSLTIYNSYLTLSETTSTCDTSASLCTLCPLSTSICLNKCSHSTFWDGSACSSCSSSCKSCVRNDAVCNLCYDEICDTCTDFPTGYCSKCKPNASLSSGSCSCNLYYFWDDVNKKCSKCNSKCKTCTGTQFLDCSTCISGNYWLSDICLTTCPTGFTSNSGTNTCDENYDLVLSLNFDTLNGQPSDASSTMVKVRTGTTTKLYPEYDTDDPYGSYKRGFYFKGSSKVYLSPYTGAPLPMLVLSPNFNIAVWARPSSNGHIIAHQVNALGVAQVLCLSITSGKAALLMRMASAGTVSISTSSITMDTWVHIGFIVKVTKSVGTSVSSYLDNTASTTNSYSYDYFSALSSNILWIIGTRYLTTNSYTSYFTGYIYSIDIWNKEMTTSSWSLATSCTSNPNACSACPSSTSICLPDCGLSEYYDSSTKTCGACKATCTTGCRNSTYCNLCEDPICNNCNDAYAGSCLECKANTQSGVSPCACKTDYIWYSTNETCSKCYSGCSICLSPIHNDCTLCADGYFLAYNECLNFCPTLFTKDSVNKICTAPSNLYVFKLDMKNVIYGELYDSKGNFKVITGSSVNFYPNYDTSDPLAADSRGYYFTGASYLNIQNSASNAFLSLSPKLTIAMWLDYMTDGTLLCKQHMSIVTTKYIELLIASGKLNLNILLTTGSFSATSTTSFTVNTWYYIVAIIDIDATANTIVTFMIDNTAETSQILAQDYFKDMPTSFTLLIGARMQTSSIQQNFFNGYLFRVSIWQEVVSDFSSEFSSSCTGCTKCPEDLVCLSTCAANSLSSDCTICPACSSTTTCIVSTTCNLCNDLKCQTCKDYSSSGCTQCKTNAEFTSTVGSSCMCSSGYSWNAATETCDVCANLCAPCYNLLTTGCTACVPGAYFHNSVCMPFCPTGFTTGTTSCSGTSGLVFRITLSEIKGTVKDAVSGNIQVITGTSSTFYPNYEANDPLAISGRGYYFGGSAFMRFVSNSNNNLQMVLSPVHTIGMWILPYSVNGILITKRTNAATPTEYMTFELSSGNLKLTFTLKLISTAYTYTSTDSITQNTWNHVGYTIYINTNTNDCELISYVNGVASSAYILTAGHYEDLTSGYLFTIAAGYATSTTLSNYFTGIINEVKIWNKQQNLALELGTCNGCKCPSSTNVCISTCLYTQYIENGACIDCQAACTNGCVRNSDCNLCNNKLCLSCQDFSSTGCVTCKTNAQKLVPSNTCQCVLGSYEDSSTSTCLSCFTYCDTCTSGKNGDCLTCKTGSYMNPETGLCLTTCPISYTQIGNICSSDSSQTTSITFQFTKLTNIMLDNSGTYGAFMGSSASYLASFDTNDPYPIYSRGVYFTGTSYASLPPNIANKTSIILGNKVTVSTWARPQSHTSNHYLFSKEDGTNLRISLFVDKTTLESKATVRVYSDSTNSPTVIQALGPVISAWDTWAEFILTVQRTGYTSEVRVYLNGVAGSVSSLPNTFFHDIASNTFEIGRSKALAAFMKGFVYEIKVFNDVIQITAPSTSCGCAGCTSSSDCLLSCNYLQYYESSCKSCLATCTTGCINGKNCNMNLDPLCSTSTGFKPSECTSCISLATGAGNGCQCMANSFFNSDSGLCECVSTYTMFQNECVPCYYPLQKTDISAYFSEDYTKIIFNCSIAVKSTTSNDCKDLFETSSYNTLGSGCKCLWSSDKMILFVTLGINATVKQDPITFKSKSLYTNTNICGIDPTAVTVNIDFKYPIPNVVPIPWLFAPLTTYIQCDDLFLDGSKSSNGFNRPLFYQWIFVSSPKLGIFSGYEDMSTSTNLLFFSKSSLSQTKLTVTMRVTNWLGLSSSIKQDVQIILGTGLHLVLDGDTKWLMKSSDSKTIFIQATSTCAYSNSLSYSWQVSSMSGDYAGYDNVALVKDQTVPSRIYIPPKVFKPGFYTFQVNVTDNVKDMSGSTQFTITVMSVDLVIILPAELFTVDVRNKFSVSAEKCFDPDLLTGQIGFNWTCVVDGKDCSSIILDQEAKVMTVNSGLVTGKSYSFGLEISKDVRTSFKEFVVKAVNYSTPVVTFSVNNEVVNSQLPIKILADVQGVGPFTYLWSLESGGPVSYSTPLDGLEIGLKPNSLAQGSKYTFRLEVGMGGGISAYKTSFTVMKQPSGGSLSITPSQGTEYSTIFKLSSPNWQDSDSPDTGILTYQFGYNLNNQVYILNIRNQSSFLYARLPYSPEPLVVWVKVLNTQGGYTLATSTVSVIKSKEDIGTLALSSLSNSLNNELSDPAELPLIIGNTALYFLSNSSKTSKEKEQAFDQVLSGIDKMIQTTVNCQYQDVQNILDVLNAVVTSYKPAKYEDISLRMQNLLTLSSASAVIIDSYQLGTYVEVIAKAAGIKNDLIRENPEKLDQANDDLKKVLAKAAGNMAAGETLTYIDESVQVMASLYNPGNFTSYVSPEVNGRKGAVNVGNFTLPTENPVLFVFILYDDVNGTGSGVPSGIDFSIVEITSTGQKVLNLDLASPIELKIPIYNYTEGEIKCVYYKANWSDYGCSLTTFQDSLAHCSCNHTSLFSSGPDLIPYIPPPPQEASPEEADHSHWLIMFYYLCGLLGAWIVFSSILLIIDQNEFSRRKRAEDSANQRYQKWYKSEEVVQKLPKPEKKVNETLTVDQNPAFFRKVNFEPDIMMTSRKEENPFLNPSSKNEPSKPDNSFLKPPEAENEVKDQTDLYLTPSKNPFSMNYFFNFFFFYDPYYTRFTRCLVLFSSLSLQCFALGVCVGLLGSQMEIPKNLNLEKVLDHLNYVSGLLCLAVILICNLLGFALQFSMQNIVNVHVAGSTMKKTRSKFWKVFGIVLSMGILGFAIFSTYFLANVVYTPASTVWLALTLLALLADLLLVQTGKMLVMLVRRKQNALSTVIPETLNTP